MFNPALIPKIVTLVVESIQAVEAQIKNSPSDVKEKEATEAIQAGIELFDEFVDFDDKKKEELKASIPRLIKGMVSVFNAIGLFKKGEKK